MICKFCGEDDRDDLFHALRCDGQQGRVEAAAPPAAPETTTITTPRETSVQAFYNAVDTGVIRTRQQQAYATLATMPDSTANEVFEHEKETQHLGLRYDSNTRARFTELRDMGLIRETGERPCRITGQTCITWAVVPSAEYVGPAVVHRCPTCGQITSRDVPRAVSA